MRRRLGNRFGPVEVVLVFAAVGLLALDNAGPERAFPREQPANPASRRLVLIDPLGDNVPGAGQSVLGRFDPLALVDKGLRLACRVEGPVLGENQFRQRLQPLLPRNRRPRSPLGPVGQIDILQDGHRLGAGDLLFELFGKQLTFFERLDY